MAVETAGLAGLLERPGVAAFLAALSAASAAASVSVGRVCGGRVAAVWLGARLEVVAETLEAHELDDPGAGRERAERFLAELREAGDAA